MKQKNKIIYVVIGILIISGATIGFFLMKNQKNQKIPDILEYAPYNLTLHTVEGGWIASNDFSDSTIYTTFQENDSNTTFSPRNITEPFLISIDQCEEHLNNSNKERNRSFSVLYIEPDSYTDVICMTHTFIEFGNSSYKIISESGFSTSNLYTMPDYVISEGGRTGNELHFNETSMNVSVYRNFQIEDYLSHQLSSGASSRNFYLTSEHVSLSLFPTITFTCFYYFINYNPSNYSVEIVKTFEFVQAQIRFEKFLIDDELQMGYTIQVFRHRFVFWHPDWLPEGYLVPPWESLSVKEET